MKKHFRRRKWLYLVFIALLVLCASAFYRGLTVRHYTVHSDKILGTRLRIVLVTDLHGCVYGDHQATLLNLIKKQKPDIIVLSGDIADEVNPLEGALWLVEGAKEIAPCYYVTGNHDLWRRDSVQVKARFRDMGVYVLEGDVLPLQWHGAQINLCGLDDPAISWPYERENYLKALTAFEGLTNDTYNILIAHRPDYIADYARYPFDLVLSGHTHGGQVRVPLLLDGLFAPNQGWFPKYVGGLYTVGQTTLAVSRGLSYDPQLPRIFNPPELVVIDILP